MAEIQVRDKLYIDGAWVPSTGSGTIDVVNATTEEVMGRVPEATPEDVDRAAKAAKAAFEGWSTISVEERGKYLVLSTRQNGEWRILSDCWSADLNLAIVGEPLAKPGTQATTSRPPRKP